MAQEDLDGVRTVEDQILSLGGELLDDLWTVEVGACVFGRTSTEVILASHGAGRKSHISCCAYIIALPRLDMPSTKRKMMKLHCTPMEHKFLIADL